MNCHTEQDIKPIFALFGQILRLNHTIMHTQIEELGVHPGQPALLRTLSHKDGMSQKDIADELHISQPTVAVTLKRIEKAGYVERRQDPNDQRITRVYLTDKGRELEKRVQCLLGHFQDIYFKGFSPEDEAVMEALLGRIKDNLLAEKKRAKDSDGTADSAEGDVTKW